MPRQVLVNTARRRILREVVEVLAGAAVLDDARGRHQWRRELAETVEALQLETYPSARQEFVEAVRACSSRPGDLELLVEATVFLAPPLTRALHPLLDEWSALDLYQERDWTALQQALQVELPGLSGEVAAITGDRVRLPPYCVTAWQAFLHLARRTAPPGGLPPSLVLLEYLAVRSELAPAVGELYAWSEHFAGLWGIADGEGGLLQLRAALTGRGRQGRALSAAPSDSDQPPEPDEAPLGQPVIRLFIKLAPDLTPAAGAGRKPGRREQRYRLSAAVKYTESVGLHHEQEGEVGQSVPRSRLPAAVAALLARMAELWQSRAEEVVLEFFLPTELLNEPVEWWNRDPAAGYPNPLFSKYPQILLHSLERLQRRDLHHAWRVRWARFKSRPEAGGVHWCDPQGHDAEEHLALLDARIGKRDEVVAMVLSGPPQSRSALGLRELRLGLDLGVPVFIHHREASTEAFRSIVRDGLSEGLAKLPARARQWKGDLAIRQPRAQQDPARHVSVIWDDPEQLLDGGPGAPAAFVGRIG